MAEVLREPMTPAYCNLGFGGVSSLTGLEILRRSGANPRVVLIEINQFHMEPDEVLLGHLFSPGLWRIRQSLTVLQDRNRPVDLFAGFPAAVIRHVSQWLAPLLAPGKAPAQDSGAPPADLRKANPALSAQILDIQKKYYEHPPETELLKLRFQQFDLAIQALRRRGCLCIFFEMPTDPALARSNWCVALRKAVHDRFPEGQYRWIAPDSEHEYETSDGVHLTRASAAAFAQYLMKKAY